MHVKPEPKHIRRLGKGGGRVKKAATGVMLAMSRRKGKGSKKASSFATAAFGIM